jgi:hypothetical protein
VITFIKRGREKKGICEWRRKDIVSNTAHNVLERELL